MRSLIVTALCLSLVHTSVARIPHSYRPLSQRDAEPKAEGNRVLNWLSQIVRRALATRQDTQDETCYEDSYYDFVAGMDPSFCQAYMHYDNVTTTVDYTPTSTVTTTITTRTHTEYSNVLVTPLTTSTVTVTAGDMASKRDAEARPEITKKAAISQPQIDKVFQMFRRQQAAGAASPSTGSAAQSSMSSAFSSACSCQFYSGPTVTETYTDDPVFTTRKRIDDEFTTLTNTRTLDAIVDLTTVTVQPEASPSMSSTTSTLATLTDTGTSESTSPSSASTSQETQTETTQTVTQTSSSNPTPTAPPFTCPEDDGTVNTQMVGDERFDYLIMCNTVLMDDDFFGGGLAYSNFGECVGACSVANRRFEYPVCQGVSFYATGEQQGTCFLKSTANNTVNATGVDSALLQRILVGVSNETEAGTTTEVAPFDQTPTQGSGDMSSSMSSMMSNSSNTMPMVTPPPFQQSGMLRQAAITGYVTSISDGSTISSGTVYSYGTTYANGSWFYTYYSAYSLQWASRTEVYGATETGNVITNSSNSETDTYNNGNGGWSTVTTTNTTSYGPYGYNVTEVISNQTYAANGSEIASTATTYYFTYQTASAEGGQDGGANGSVPANTTATSTSVASTQTLVGNSGSNGGAAGGFNGGGAGGPGPSPSSTTSVNGTAGATSTEPSGGPGGTAYATSTAASGAFTNSEGSRIGVPGSSTSSPSIPILNSSSGGYVPPTATSSGTSSSFSSSTAISSSSMSSSSSTSRSVSGLPRSGTYSTTSTTSSTFSPPPFSGPSYYYPGPSSSSSGSSSQSSSSSSTSASHSGENRSGTISTSSTSTSTSGLPMSTTSSTESSTTSSPPPYTGPSYPGFSNTGGNRSPYPYPSPSHTTSKSTSSMYSSTSMSTGSSSSTEPSHSTTSPPSTSSSSTSVSISGQPRSPASFTSSSTSFPTITTCANATMGTTTLFMTTTILGCDSTCMPGGGYGPPHGNPYAAPETFGPPAWWTSTAETSTEIATTSTASM